ncbi:MAG: hypothetical protein WDO56_03395 [Gammaproteobacteria bacterium]
MLGVKKDVTTRVLEVINAWEKMRPYKQFFGLGLEDFKARAKPFLDAREEIAGLEAQVAHAVSKRDAAAIPLLEIVQGVVAAVRGDPAETQNGELYSAMGYVPKNQKSTGLVRGSRRNASAAEGGSG